MALRFPRISVILGLSVALSASLRAPVAGRQQPEPVGSWIGVRSYLFPGVFDNLSLPQVAGPDLPTPLGLRRLGLYRVDQMPGYQQRIEVQPGHENVRVQTLSQNRPAQRTTLMSIDSYLELLRREQSRRLLLAGFKESLTPEEERRSLLEFEIPISVPRGLSSVVGEGGAGLRLSGNRNIRFSGRSEWTEGAVSSRRR